MVRKFSFLCLLITLLLSFCSRQQEPKPPPIKLEKDLDIGVDVGDENYMFAGIIDIEVDTDGNIYVLDWKYHTIKKYGLDGKFIRNIGSRGQGPGEFSAILVDSCLDENNRLYVLELMKVHIFDQEGEYIDTFNPGFFPFEITFNHEGKLVLIGKKEGKFFHVFTAEGEFLESFGEGIPALNQEYEKFGEIWGPLSPHISKDGRIYFFNPFKYEIFVYREKQLEQKISRNVPGYKPPELTLDEEGGGSWSSSTLTSLLDTPTFLFAFYSPKNMREEDKGIIDIFNKTDYMFLGSIEVKGLPWKIGPEENIYFREGTDVLKVVKYKILQTESSN